MMEINFNLVMRLVLATFIHLLKSTGALFQKKQIDSLKAFMKKTRALKRLQSM